MHKEILAKEQLEILQFLSSYKKKYYLVGGTAIAFYLGHRESIDFDLFTAKKIDRSKLKKEIQSSGFANSIILELPNQIHFIINNVKLTFFEYPFILESPNSFENTFKMPDLLTLAAMKAFALGGRAKWKDYVDLYFLIKHHFTIDQIATKAKLLFIDSFNPLLFKKQLCYFKDINYEEQVNYLSGFETNEQTIKDFLINKAIEI